MKLKAINYVSPVETQGIFEEVFVEDAWFKLDRTKNYFQVFFHMYIMKNEKKIVLAESLYDFFGMNNSENSNKPVLVEMNDNQGVFINLFKPDGSYNIDVKKAFTIVDYGYPSFEDMKNYINNGSIDSPELIIENDFAKEFILNKIFINGEFLKTQFNFI